MSRLRLITIAVLAALVFQLIGATGITGSSKAWASGTVGPAVTQLAPASGETAVPSGSSLRITFDENIIRGPGDITILSDDGTGNFYTFDTLHVLTDLNNVLLEQPTRVATIVPHKPLTPGTYQVRIDNFAIASLSTSNYYAGISTWTFTVVDSGALKPTYSPTSGTTDVSADTAQTISMTYPAGKTMKKGTGNIYVKRSTDDATSQTISVASSAVTITGSVVKINLSRLDYGTAYYILMDQGAILDAGNNAYGISNPTEWSFATKAANDQTAPTASSFTPVSGGTLSHLTDPLKVRFSENVYPGSGSFTLYQGSTVFCTIPANSPAISDYGSNTISIAPRTALCPAFANNTSYSVTVSSLAVHDAAGNNYAGTTGWSFKALEDVAAPEIVSLTPAAGAINVDPNVGSMTIKFNKQVKVTAGAKARIKTLSGTLAGTILSYVNMTVSASDSTQVVLSGIPTLTANMEYAVYIDNNTIQGAVNNAVFPGILNDYRWSFRTLGSDTTAPVLSSASMDGMSVVLNYNEDLDESSSSTPEAANYYVTINDVPTQVSSVEVKGRQVFLKLQNSVAVGQKVTVSYTIGSNPVRDQSGNRADNLSGVVVSNTTDTTVPKPSSGSISGNVLTLIFNKTLNDLPSNAANQFSVRFDGSARSIQSISLNGSVMTMVLNSSPTSSQSVSVSYSPGSPPVQDRSGNAMAAFTNFYVTNGIDLTPPTLVSGSASGTTVTLSFNEGLNAGVIPPKSSFSVLMNGAAAYISSVGISNNTVTLVLTDGITAGSTVRVTYIPGTLPLQDLTGNSVALISNYPISVNAASGPVYSTGSINGNVVTLSFSGALNSSYVPYQSQFTVLVGGGIATVTGVNVSGSTVTLPLLTTVQPTQSVTVSYSPNGNSLQDSLGQKVGSFGPVALTNGTAGPGPADYLAYNSEGGLTYSMTAATTGSDTLASGTSATRYTLDSDKLSNAFTLLRLGGQVTKLQLNFVVPSSESGALVALPLRALSSGNAYNPTASIRMDYGNYQFEYPLQAIGINTMNQAVSTDSSAYLLIDIERATAATLSSAVSLQGGTLLEPAEQFSVFIVKNGSKSEVTAFDQNVTRSVTMSYAPSYPDSQLAIVRYDYDSSDVSYTPTAITRSGGTLKLSSSSKGSGPVAAVYRSKNYSDAASLTWAKDSINSLASKFIIDGPSSTTFRPNQNITRADFAKYIAKGLGLVGNKSAATRYTDVGANGSYSGYIGAVSTAGIVMGDTDGRFRPNAYITREEMATMMQRAMSYTGTSVTSWGTELNAFKDKNKVSTYAKAAVLQNIAAGIMNGTSTTKFEPQSNATRAQAAVMLDRMLNYVGWLQD